MFLIGKVIKTHGVRGEVKVKSYTDFNRFVVKNEVVINQKEYTIKSVRTQNEILLISFVGLESLNDVISLVGHEVFASELISEQLADDEYHLPSLIGLSVYTDTNVYVGRVKDVLEVPQGHMLEIYNDDEKKILIPFIKVFIKDVLETKIIITPIEGLI